MTERAAKIFNGTFTVTSYLKSNGKHRTFKISTMRNEDHFLHGQRVLYLMTGSDNNSSYRRFGTVTDDGIRIFTKCSTPENKAYADLLWSMLTEGDNSKYVALGYTISASLNCIMCNKKLTTPESLARGIGPVCDGRI